MVKKIVFAKYIVLMCLIFNEFFLFGQSGTIDTTFNSGQGRDFTISSGFGSTGSASPVVMQSDGKVLVSVSSSGMNIAGIYRYNSNGILDTSFNHGSVEVFEYSQPIHVSSIALQGDGKILIGGTFSKYRGIPRNCIARLNEDGSVDESFHMGTGISNSSFDAVVRTIIVQPDGKILLQGDFTSYNGSDVYQYARLNSDGTIDSSFTQTIDEKHTSISSIGLQADGKILLGGYLTFKGISVSNLARINSDGSRDSLFNLGVWQPVPNSNVEIESIATQADGKILVGGYFSSFNGIAKNNILRLNSDGTLDNTFKSGTGTDNHVWSIVVRPNGKILIGGNFTLYNVNNVNALAELNSDGTFNNSFKTGINSTTSTSYVSSIALQDGGEIIVGGYLYYYQDTYRTPIVRLKLDGSLDNSFTPESGANNPVTLIKLQADGKILIGGSFISYNGTAANRIVRLNSDGSIDSTFNTGKGLTLFSDYINPYLAAAIQVDGKIILGGSFKAYNGVSVNHLVRLNSNGSIDNTFNIGTGPNSGAIQVSDILIQPDGKIIVAGDFSTFNGKTSGVIRLNADGSLDNSFNASPSARGEVLAIQADGKILVGGLSNLVNVVPYKGGLYRLNTDGTLDPSFYYKTGIQGNNFDVGIKSMIVQPDEKILISGKFYDYNGYGISCLARLKKDGVIDSSFYKTEITDYPLTEYIESMALQSNRKILIGNSFKTKGYFNKLNSDGTSDLEYQYKQLQPGPNGSVSAIAIQPDGKIILGGSFTSYNNYRKNFIIRIIGDTVIPSKNEIAVNKNPEKLSLYPNPTTGDVTVKFSTQETSFAEISVYDLLGQKVWSENMNVASGQNQIPVSTSTLSDGLYLLKIVGGSLNMSNSLVVRR